MARAKGVDKKYTVIIQYPKKVLDALDLDFNLRAQGISRVFVAHVKGKDTLEAIKEGKHQAMRAQENEYRGVMKDWTALAVLDGHAKVEWVS